MRVLRKGLPLAAMGMLLFSCATNPNVYKAVDADVAQGVFDGAIETIVARQTPPEGKKQPKKPIYPEKNAVMLYLDKGIIEHYAGDYEASAVTLGEAERLITEAFTKSVTAEITSYIANDNTKDYAGEDYEDLYVNVFNALNYYHKGDVEGAGVEIRRLTEKLSVLEDKYAGGGNKVKEFLIKQIDTVQFPESTPAKLKDSALARYMSAIIYRSMGQNDNARIDIDALKAVYRSSGVYQGAVPASVDAELTVPAGQGRLNVIAFTGLSPVKEERLVAVPTANEFATYNAGYLLFLNKKGKLDPKETEKAFAFLLAKNFIKEMPVVATTANDEAGPPKTKGQSFIAGTLAVLDTAKGMGEEGAPIMLLHMPKLVDRPSGIKKVDITVNGTKTTLDMLEDMGAVMEETFKSQYSSLLFKTFARTGVKAFASEAVGWAAISEEDDKRPLRQRYAEATPKKIADARSTAQLAMVGLDKTEAADTRSARYFPGKAYVGGVNLNPGDYEVTITYYDAKDGVVASEKKTVTVKAGALNLVEGVSLK